MRNTEPYDLVVIGGGSAGLVAARFGARIGAHVALVERARLGGDCTWTGCVPSKALLKAARIAHTVRSAADYGIGVGPPVVAMDQVRAYVQRAVDAVYRSETPAMLEAEGVEVLRGLARFVDAKTLDVEGRRVQGRRFLVATGARPRVPEIPGLPEVAFWTSETVFENAVLPKRLTVVGGGPLAAEIAQAYARLGAQVTIVAEQWMPREDDDARNVLRAVFAREGVRIVEAAAESVHDAGETVAVTAGGEMLRSERLLVATGRAPSVAELGLDRAGVTCSAAGVPVDTRLRTNVEHIYAAGDVLGTEQFTHYAGWQGFYAARNALLPGSARGVASPVPRVTFTDPELAQAGLTQREAEERFGGRLRVHRWGLERVDRAVCEGDTTGFVKLVARPDGTLLGATIVAERAGETLGEIVVALAKGLGLDALAGAIHPYPTYGTPLQQIAGDAALERFVEGTAGKLVRRWSGFDRRRNKAR